jgi:cytochrome c oxidase subunit III
MSSKRKNPYHLVRPSPWPIVGAISAFLLTSGTILMVRGITSVVLIAGVILTLFTMAGWWYDVIQEAKTEHTSVVRRGFRYGMGVFILSEVMFFVAFFWAYLNASLMPNEAMGNVWPPKGVHTIDPFDLPYLNTLILLTSGNTITWAHHSLTQGDPKSALRMTAWTILLGILFLSVQIYEFAHADFAFKGGIYPSTFYMATGFHGFHVFVGVCFLSVCWARTFLGQFTAKDHFGFEAATWYWHFVDVVWLFLFTLIYWWGAGK